MLKKIFYMVISIFIIQLANAQKNTEDVLYLKNTGVIRGRIISSTADSIIKIELAGGSIFVFQQKDIDSIKKGNRYKNKLSELQEPYFRKEKGFRNVTEASLLYGPGQVNGATGYYYYTNTPDDVGLSIHTINGYQFSHFFFLGAGIGIDRFITYQQTFSPFYVRLSSEFLKKKASPYIYFDAGYSLMWKPSNNGEITYLDNEGGLYLAAGGGVRIYTRSRASVLLSAGYKYNNSQSDWAYTYGSYLYTVKRTYQRIAVNVGATF